MIEINYEMNVVLTCSNVEEGPSPIRHVTNALETLLNDTADEWLIEAIGHPNCQCSVKVNRVMDR